MQVSQAFLRTRDYVIKSSTLKNLLMKNDTQYLQKDVKKNFQEMARRAYKIDIMYVYYMHIIF